jgi:hypothetical protein
LTNDNGGDSRKTRTPAPAPDQAVIDISQDKPSVSKRKQSALRGTRIPDPFLLTSEMRDWANERVPNIDITTETEKFVNYYRGLAGAKATKIDWIATWRHWLLNAKEWTTNGKHIYFL